MEFGLADRRFDDTGDAERHLVLESEDILKGVLEPGGPDL